MSRAWWGTFVRARNARYSAKSALSSTMPAVTGVAATGCNAGDDDGAGTAMAISGIAVSRSMATAGVVAEGAVLATESRPLLPGARDRGRLPLEIAGSAVATCPGTSCVRIGRRQSVAAGGVKPALATGCSGAVVAAETLAGEPASSSCAPSRAVSRRDRRGDFRGIVDSGWGCGCH